MVYHFDITFEADNLAEAKKELMARLTEMWQERGPDFDPDSFGHFWSE